MRKIIKNPEPEAWIKFRKTPGVEFESIPELKDALLKEQGYICAYCMRRIPCKDDNSYDIIRVEHILSRKNHPDEEHVFGYNNLVACCTGAIGMSADSENLSANNFHCDRKKCEQDVSFNLFSESFIETLSYNSKDGTIKSSNTQYNKEINEILNLNHCQLKRNRFEALRGVITQLSKIKSNWTKSNIEKVLAIWNEKDQDGYYKPYCGIVIWYLKKKLQQQQ